MDEGIKIGPDTHQLVEQIFHQCKHTEQGFKTCQGVLQLAKKYGNDKVEQAACICLQYEFVSYRKLEYILSLHYFDHFTDDAEGQSSIATNHENIRGQSYYQ